MRKKSVLVALAIFALGLTGMGLSTLYSQNKYIEYTTTNKVTFGVSYGFPLGWHGHTVTDTRGNRFWGLPPEVYWFSLESLLANITFWFVISSFVSLSAIKSARALNLVSIARNACWGRILQSSYSS